MKWVLIAVGAFGALIVLMLIVGLLLPKGHVVARTVRFKRSPAEVWRLITAFADQPDWRSELSKVERMPDRDGREVWNELRSDGWGMPLQTTELVPEQRLVRTIADPKLPFGGTWTYELSPRDDGCELTITERGEVYNPFFRVFSRFADMRASIDAYLKALGRKFGEEVTLRD
jgi:uncharacterized protein YndB with AHSA1/START domain